MPSTTLPARGADRTTDGIAVLGPVSPAQATILTPDALRFVAGLQREFNARRHILISQRRERQARFDAGQMPDFLAKTEHVREQDWRVAPLPHDLADRRVEITGPVDRKMVINALNSGAQLLHGRFRGFPLAHVERHARRPNQPPRCRGRHDRLRRPRERQALRAQSAGRHADGAAPRLAPRRAARESRSPAGVGLPVRLRAVLLPQLRRVDRAGAAAPTSICPSSKAISKPGSGTTFSSRRSTTSAFRRARFEPPC